MKGKSCALKVKQFETLCEVFLLHSNSLTAQGSTMAVWIQ